MATARASISHTPRSILGSPGNKRGKTFPMVVAPHSWSEGMGLIPSIHHFPGSETMGQWPRTMGWTSCPEATFINAVPVKGTTVNVKLSRPFINLSWIVDRKKYIFWAATIAPQPQQCESCLCFVCSSSVLIYSYSLLSG